MQNKKPSSNVFLEAEVTVHIVFSGSPGTCAMTVLVSNPLFLLIEKEGLPLYITFVMNIFPNRHQVLRLKGLWLMSVTCSLCIHFLEKWCVYVFSKNKS